MIKRRLILKAILLLPFMPLVKMEELSAIVTYDTTVFRNWLLPVYVKVADGDWEPIIFKFWGAEQPTNEEIYQKVASLYKVKHGLDLPNQVEFGYAQLEENTQTTKYQRTEE